VDGEIAAALRAGDDAVIPVAPGAHTLRAKIDWCGSRSIDVELGEHDKAHVVCQAGWRSVSIVPRKLLYTTILRDRYLDLELTGVESAS